MLAKGRSGVRMRPVMSSLSPRLQVRVQQKQILTPGLVQMVSLLQLNRLELKDMIQAEVAQNPVLEEGTEGGEELSPEEVQALLETERVGDPADQSILDVTPDQQAMAAADAGESGESFEAEIRVDQHLETSFETPPAATAETGEAGEIAEAPTAADAFDQIDFDNYFNDYLDPGFKSPASENVEKPSFETFLSSPVTLSDHLRSQLALVMLSENVRDAAEGVIGNLDENGYLTATPEEMAEEENLPLADVLEAIRVVHTLDPAGVGASDLRECLLLQIESINGKGGVAWQVVSDHLKLVETRQFKE